MLGGGGGSSATSLRRRVWRDWMASILSGGASWIPAMAAVSLAVAIMILQGSCYLWNWDGMMLEPEHVGDPLVTCVSHENPNASIVIRGTR